MGTGGGTEIADHGDNGCDLLPVPSVRRRMRRMAVACATAIRVASCSVGRSSSGGVPVLGVGEIAGVDLQLGAAGGGGVGVVDAFAGGGVPDLPVGVQVPDLGRVAAAAVQLDFGSVCGAGVGDVPAVC